MVYRCYLISIHNRYFMLKIEDRRYTAIKLQNKDSNVDLHDSKDLTLSHNTRREDQWSGWWPPYCQGWTQLMWNPTNYSAPICLNLWQGIVRMRGVWDTGFCFLTPDIFHFNLIHVSIYSMSGMRLRAGNTKKVW